MSLHDYIPTLPEGSFDIPEDLDLDLSQSFIDMTHESTEILTEFTSFESDLEIIAKFENRGIAIESDDSTIGVRIGTNPLIARALGGQKDPITGKIELAISVEPKISIGELFIRKVKELAKRVWTAIKNFFISIFHFFQSKIVQTDKMLSSTNFPAITAYYTGKESIKIKLTQYMISDPMTEFLNDSEILKSAIPSLRDAIISIINTIKNPIGDFSNKQNISNVENNAAEIQKIITKIYRGVFPTNFNFDLISDVNIARVIRQKYFGDKKQQAVQEIRDVVKTDAIYEYIISDEAFKSFRELYRENERTIHEATREVDKFKRVLQEVAVSSTFYTELRATMATYRRLLTTMLFTCTAYWELYFTIYNDVIKCARTIIQDIKN